MNLKTLRELKGMSRKELAELTGISFRSIQDYEQGHKQLSSAKAETLMKMGQALECSIEALLSEEDLSAFKPSNLRQSAQDGGEGERPAGRTAPIVYELKPEEVQPYFLMHKNITVAAVTIEPLSGCIVGISEIFEEAHMPLGTLGPDTRLKAWWYRRAVPLTQGSIQETLEHIGFVTPQAYLVRNLGLSMSDCYWIKPVNTGLRWEEVNLFDNEFEDVVASVHFSGLGAKIDFSNFDIRFPGASARGSVPKAWICVEGRRRFLVKGSEHGRMQQIFNEVAAAYMHRRQGSFDYADYQFYMIETGHGQQLGACCESFTDASLEFVPARDLLALPKHGQESDYEHFINQCVAGGLEQEQVVRFLDYQILSDFVITNTDRSFENFGVLRDPEQLNFVKLAPIFDCGNSMFYATDMSRGTLELKNIPVSSFAPNEVGLLRLVQDFSVLDMSKLPDNEEIQQVLSSCKRAPEEIKLIMTIYSRKKDLLQKLKRGDTAWMQ